MAWRRLAGPVLALLLCAAGLVGCSREDPVMVALLLPNANAERWTSVDVPAFSARVAQTCRGCETRSYLADGDPARQAEQFAEALDAGADVIVLAAVEPQAAVPLVADAEVPVVAYDRFIEGADYFVSHDTTRIGRLQGEAIVAATGGRGRMLMINGGREDPNAAAIKSAVRSVLRDSSLRVVAELDPPDWSAEQARAWVADELARRPGRDLAAIYAANDVQAGGVVQALSEAGVRRADLPVITGQDAELVAIRRLVLGEQHSTVMKRIREQAQQAADIGVALLTGAEVDGGEVRDGVRTWIFEPEVVTAATISNTVVKHGLLQIKDICSGETAERCARLGLR